MIPCSGRINVHVSTCAPSVWLCAVYPHPARHKDMWIHRTLQPKNSCLNRYSRGSAPSSHGRTMNGTNKNRQEREKQTNSDSLCRPHRSHNAQKLKNLSTLRLCVKKKKKELRSWTSGCYRRRREKNMFGRKREQKLCPRRAAGTRRLLFLGLGGLGWISRRGDRSS